MAFRRNRNLRKRRGGRRRLFRRKGKGRVRGRRKPFMMNRANRKMPSIGRPIRFFTDIMRSTLRWDSDEVVIDTPSMGVSAYPFRANSPYDPDATLSATQHSAYGFTDIMNFYGSYRVIASVIKVWPVGTGAVADLNPVYVTCILQKANANYYSFPYQILETYNRGPVRINGAYLGTSTSGPQRKIADTYYSQKGFYGNQAGNNDFKGTQGADPQQVAYFMLYNASVADNNPTSRRYRVQITYYCEFADRLEMTMEEQRTLNAGDTGAAISNTGSYMGGNPNIGWTGTYNGGTIIVT